MIDLVVKSSIGPLSRKGRVALIGCGSIKRSTKTCHPLQSTPLALIAPKNPCTKATLEKTVITSVKYKRLTIFSIVNSVYKTIELEDTVGGLSGLRRKRDVLREINKTQSFRE